MKTENIKNFWASIFVVAMFFTTTATVIADPPQQSGGVVPIPPGSIVPVPPGEQQNQQPEGSGQPSDEGGGGGPYIEVITPNGGENWQRGTNHIISWDSYAVGSYVRIDLYRGCTRGDNGFIDSTIVSSTTNNGIYTWNIPSSQTIASTYKVKITSLSNSNLYDYSDNCFTISLSPTCQVLWNKTWSYGTVQDFPPGEAGRVTTDNNNNIYVCGFDNYLELVVLKYDPNGNLIWVRQPTSFPNPENLVELAGYQPTRGGNKDRSGLPGYIVDKINISSLLWGIVYDGSSNSVISCGSLSLDIGDFSMPVVFVIKYSTSGTFMWCRTFSFILQTGVCFSIGTDLAVDTNGNIYLSGTALVGNGNLTILKDPSKIITAVGLAMKLNSNSIVQWAKVDENPNILAYTGIDVDSNGYPFESGYTIDHIDWHYEFVIVKRDKTSGDVIDSYTRNNNFWCVHMVIDRNDNNNIYCVGDLDVGNTGIIVKMTSSLDLVYETMTPDDVFYDVAIKNSQYLVIGSKRAPTDTPYYYLTLRPNGDDVKQLYRYPTGSIHYTAVDEEQANDGTDYVYSYYATTHVYDTFEMQNHGTQTKPIYGLQVCARIGLGIPGDGSPNQAKFIIKKGAYISYSPELPLYANVWQDCSYIFTTNPWTGQAWSWNDIDTLKVGIDFVGTLCPSMQCTQIYCVIQYQGTLDQYTIALHSKDDGHQFVKFKIGDVHDAHSVEGQWTSYVVATAGVAVDSTQKVIACAGLGVTDTMKCLITGG